MAKQDVKDLINTPAEELMHDADEIIISPNDFNKNHLEAIRYAARFLRYKGYLDESEELLMEAGIDPVPTYELSNSEYIQRLEAEGLRPHVQGFLKAGSGKDAIRYPIIVMNGDIMRWEMFYQKLKHDLKEEAKAELQNGDS